MKKTHLRRSLAAVGLAVITLMAMSTPASAAVHDGAITGGVITSTKTGVTETINLAPTTASCTSTTLSADFGTETLGGTFAVTALGASHVQAYSNGQSYLTVLSRSTTGNTNGTWTSGSSATSHFVTNNRIAIVATIYNTTSCTITGTPACTVAAILNISSTFPTSLASGGTFSATGSSIGSVVAFPTCVAGPSQILGTTLSVTTAITGTVTT